MMRALAMTAAVSFILAACATAPGPVAFTSEWPAEAADYVETTRDWTRRGTIRQGYDQVLDLSATFKSTAWRAAYVDRRMTSERLPEDERPILVEGERKADAQYYEFELLVATYEHDENDLQKGEKSIWRMVLVDDRGIEIEPASVQRDRRPFEIIRSEYPHLDDVAVAYIARFPKQTDVLADGAKKFSLKMSSARGVVELVWLAQ
jgi:hypothetical protein